ncbi:MAG TPA: hypothetical protein VMV69_29390 [Pirellulales bacterium]|nr:hypothetical protein [Pirellulales bacterium]
MKTTMLAVLVTLLGATAARAEVTLADIIENVRRNEAIYENLDVVIHSEYDIGDRAPVKFGNGSAEVLSDNKRLRYVRQGGMFRLDRTGSSVDTERTVSGDRVRAYDGETTRGVDGNTVANLIQGKQDDPDLVRPHMFLLRDTSHSMAPLSTYLSGTEAMKSHPEGFWTNDHSLANTYEGEADFMGLRCHRVRITTVLSSGDAHDSWELWLAEDRNYLPVRMLAFTFHVSADTPVGDGAVTDLREIEPNVWFPFAADVTAYDLVVMKREGKRAIRWRRKYWVEDVSLDPHYDLAYFRDVTIPDGTAVYEIVDGEIASSYRQGAPPTGGVSRPLKRWWLWAMNVVIGILVVAVWRLQCRRRRLANSSPPSQAE